MRLQNSRRNVLKALRVRFSDTQEDLAERLNITRHTVLRWESDGSGKVPNRAWKNILKAYKVSQQEADNICTEEIISNRPSIVPKAPPPCRCFVSWEEHGGNTCIGFDDLPDGGNPIYAEPKIRVHQLRGLRPAPSKEYDFKITRKHRDLLFAALERYVVEESALENMETQKTETTIPDADLV